MLIKIEQVDAYNEWDSSKQEYRVSIEGRWEAWINPERITRVSFKVAFEGFAEIKCGTERLQVTIDEARRIIDHINTPYGFPSLTEERLKQQAVEEIEAAAKAAATLPYEKLPYVSQYHAPEQPLVNLDSFKAMIRDEHFVVLDTETTGLERGEIVQIAIVEKGGNVILNTLVKPVEPIPPDATRIHGITDEMVKDAPTWEQVRRDVFYAIAGRHCVVYNAVYDRKMMHQSAERRGMVKLDWKEYAAFWCAMEAFAEVFGDWNDYRGNYRWQKLSTAAAHYGIAQKDAHTALDDALTTLAVCKAMAAE